MSDELKIITKVELDTDEAKKKLQEDLGKKPVPLDIEIDTDKIQTSLENAFTNATKTLGTKIKDAINNAVKGTKLDIGRVFSDTAKGTRGYNKISDSISFMFDDSIRNARERFASVAKEFSSVFNVKDSKYTMSSVTYDNEKEQYTAVVNYETALGRVHTLTLQLGKDSDQVFVKQQKITENAQAYLNALKESAIYVSNQNAEMKKMQSQVWGTDPKLRKDFSDDVKVALAELQLKLESTGDIVSDEARAEINRAVSTVRELLKEAYAAQSAYDSSVKQTANYVARIRNEILKLDSEATQQRNPLEGMYKGQYDSERQAVVDALDAIGDVMTDETKRTIDQMIVGLRNVLNEAKATQSEVDRAIAADDKARKHTADYIARQRNEILKLDSKAFEQNNPLEGAYEASYLSAKADLEDALDAIGDVVTDEAERTINELLVKLRIALDEARKAQSGATDFYSKSLPETKESYSSKLGTEFIKAQQGGVLDSAIELRGVTTTVRDEFDRLKTELKDIDSFPAFQRWKEQLDTLKSKIIEVKTEIKSFTVADADSHISKIQGEIQKLNTATSKTGYYSSGVEDLADEFEDIATQFEALKQKLASGNLSDEEYKKITQAVKELEERQRIAVERANSYHAALSSGTKEFLDYNAKVETLESTLGNLKQRLANLPDAFGVNLKNALSKIPDLSDVDPLNIDSILTEVRQLSSLELGIEKQYGKFETFSKEALLASTHVDGLSDEVAELQIALNNISSPDELKSWVKQFSIAEDKVTSFKKSIQGQALFKGLELDSYTSNIDRMLNFDGIKNGTTSGVTNLRNTLTSLKSEIELVSQKLKYMPIDDTEYEQLTSTLEELIAQYKSAASVAKKFDGTFKSQQGIDQFNEQAETAKKKLQQLSERWSAFRTNPALLNQFRELVELSGDLDPTNLNIFNKKIQEWSANVKAAGLATQSFGDKISAIGNFFVNWITLPELMSRVIQAGKSMAQTVVEIDTSMTELKKVTTATAREYNAFLDNAGKKAIQLGSTITDLIDSSSIFARLGYGLDEAAQLGEVASIYHLVGDEVDSIDSASKSLVSTMQAFDILPSEAISVIDKLNIAGKLLPEPVVTRCLEEYYIGQSRVGYMCA